jgi:archaeal type IV pilus assembly protein PilA
MKSVIRNDEAAVSPVIATILMVAITVVLAAVLYVMVSGLLTPVGSNKPVLTFSSPNLTTSPGNATISVADTSQAVGPANYKVNLQVGSLTGTAIAMPTTSGAFVSITVNSIIYRVYWTDIGGGQTIKAGSQFRISGNNVPLTTGSNYIFYLLWSDGSQIQTSVWNT